MSTTNENEVQLTPTEEVEQLRLRLEESTIREAEYARREAEYQRNRERWEARVDREVTARRELEERLQHIPANAKEYLHPTLEVPESPIVLPRISFEIHPSFITEVKRNKFQGKPNECPLEHVTSFVDLCDAITDGATLEYLKLKAFRWSLAGIALHWFEGLPPKSIRTWNELQDLFLNKFFPPAKTAALRQQIMAFRQKPGETLAQVWERYKRLLRSCPTHGQPPYVIQEIIFNCLDAPTKERINNYTAYRYIKYTPQRAWETFETLANYDNTYGTSAAATEGYQRPAPSMPLYEPPKEIDPEIREQFHNDQVRDC